jgi:hypothetical protein
MPEKRSGESLSAFIGRFVSSKREKKQFPSIKQRLAVGFAEARQAAKRRSNA